MHVNSCIFLFQYRKKKINSVIVLHFMSVGLRIAIQYKCIIFLFPAVFSKNMILSRQKHWTLKIYRYFLTEYCKSCAFCAIIEFSNEPNLLMRSRDIMATNIFHRRRCNLCVTSSTLYADFVLNT